MMAETQERDIQPSTQHEHTPALYHYRSLEADHAFRLIKVSRHKPPANSKETTSYSYEIVHASIDTTTPPYQAVSYVWGVGKRDEPLTLCDGTCILVTKSLATAINILSEHCSTGYLWIDQICINQEDLAERSKQVANMYAIYFGCEEVLIKLHDDFEKSQFSPASKDFLSTADDISQEDFNATLEKLRSSNSEEYYVVTYVSNDAWFKRAWVFQEYVLPPRARFIIKNCAIPPSNMSKLVTFSNAKFPNSAGKSFGNFEKMKDARKRQPKVGWSVTPIYLFLANVVPGTEATDPRDLIYAFLGLQHPDIFQVINPDYTLHYDDVLIESTIGIMKHNSSLAIFSILENDQREVSGDKSIRLPTWVVDWRECSLLRPTIDFHNLALGPRYFDAASGRKYSPICDIEFLKVPGKHIDTISYVLDSNMCPPSMIWGARWKDTFDEEPGEYHPASSLRIDQNVAKINNLQKFQVTCERFLRVVLADCSHRYQLGRDFVLRDDIDWTNYHQFYLEWKAKFSGGLVNHNKEFRTNPYLYVMEVCAWLVYERRVFVTGKGKLGLGPKSVQICDQISILHGSTTPIILRYNGKSNTHGVIGDCYLEDVMFGEAVDWEEDTCDIFTLG